MMPLKCRNCEYYCLTPYKREYHGCVEGCGVGKTNTKYPDCFETKTKEGNTDEPMGSI